MSENKTFRWISRLLPYKSPLKSNSQQPTTLLVDPLEDATGAHLRRVQTEPSQPYSRQSQPSAITKKRRAFSFPGSASDQKPKRRTSFPKVALHWLNSSGNSMANEDLVGKIKEGTLEIENDTDQETYEWVPFDHIEELLGDEANVRAVLRAVLEKQPKMTYSVHDDMTRFVLGKAKRLFAVLVRYNKLDWLKLFYDKGFADDQFPIERKSVKDLGPGYVGPDCKWAVRSIRHPENYVPFPVEKDDIDYLCRLCQWHFFVPVFTEDDEPVYIFSPSQILPFIEEIDTGVESNFSVVRHYVIHPRHIELQDDQIVCATDARGNPHVAVKRLKFAWSKTAGKSKEIALNESNVLYRFKENRHRHLIRVIACYSQGSDYFFMFPWAPGGSLRDFWKECDILAEESLNFGSKDWELYIEWFLRQLKGLAEAIKILHYSKDKPGESCRHGDLKPENILCFGNRLPARGEIPTDITLVITDAGLAKVHERETQARLDPTTTQGGTRRYASPEVEIDKNHARSRLYDIWSLGVLYLEFLIWILYGKESLKKFHDDTSGDYCFDTHPEPRVKPIVTKWIQAIKDDPRCSSSGPTALGRLIDLIEHRLLVVAYSNTQGQSPDAEAESQGARSSSSNVPQMLVTRATWSPLSDNKPIRADAEATLRELEKIYDAAKEQKSLPWINWDGMAEAAKQGPKIVSNLEPRPRSPSVSNFDATPRMSEFVSVFDAFRSKTSSDNFARQTLDNNWEFELDDNMAQQIVPQSAEKVLQYDVSTLCDRCQTMKIWSKDFEFYDTMSSLEDRSGYCGLCGLLCRAMLDRAARRDEVIKFIRNRSSLTFGYSHWSPILSLCTTSESETLRSNEVQLGFPSLADPGKETQMKIVSSWIESCDKTQHIPDAGTFIPSRLLHVGDMESSRVRLLCDLGDQIRPVKYAALSHRWGNPEQKQPKHVTAAVTTFDNLGMIASPEGLDQSELPRTFQDAISVTRKLNLNYLWIDSLCILQRTGKDRDAESSADWEKESKLMEQIFHSAYITIAASCAEHRFDGFLKPRASRQFVTMAADDGSLFHICEVIDNFDAHVEQGELNKRAWVLQERALSRRTIYFTDTQVYWECGQGIRCETFTKMKNRKASFLGDSNFPHSAETYKEGRKLQHYQDLYEKFSTLGLTYPSDRPRAISGLETRLMKAMDSAGGYGVFESHFHRGLLWHRELSTPRLERIKLKSDDKVPSWSWTAFSGEIRYMNVPLGRFEKNDKIMSPFQIDKPTTSNASESEARSSEIKAPLRTLTENHQGWLILDDPKRKLEKPLHCIVVGKNHQQQHGKQAHYVLLVEENRELEAYERVGVAYLNADGLEPGIDSRIVRIW